MVQFVENFFQVIQKLFKKQFLIDLNETEHLYQPNKFTDGKMVTFLSMYMLLSGSQKEPVILKNDPFSTGNYNLNDFILINFYWIESNFTLAESKCLLIGN